MNQTITSREELLLAKIAGRDVDLRTMTPGVPTNLCEKFMLEIADRLDNMSGGSSETYETVAEIAVGEMTDNGTYWEADGLYPSQSLPEEDGLFFNDPNYPLTYVSAQGVYEFNVDMEGGTPIGTPAYAIITDGGSLDLMSTEDLSNTTVKILKKVSAPSGDGGKFVVDLTPDESSTPEYPTYTATKDGEPISFAEVLEACEAKKNVVCTVPAPGEMGIPFELQLLAYFSQSGDEGVMFSGISPVDGIYMYTATGFTDGNEDVWAVGSDRLRTVPNYDGASEGDVLTMGSSSPTWARPSGGKFIVTLDKALETVVSFDLKSEPDGNNNGYPYWEIEMTQQQFDHLDHASNLYVNSRDNPLETTSDDPLGYYCYCNFVLDSGEPIGVRDPDKMAYYIRIDANDNYSGILVASEDISEQTVDILEPGDNYEADKTIAQCAAAVDSGKIVECVVDDVDAPLTLNFVTKGASEGMIEILFSGTIVQYDGAIFCGAVGVSNDGLDTWGFVQSEYDAPAEKLHVRFSHNGTSYTCDKTYLEIYNAYLGGNGIEAVYELGDGSGRKCILSLASYEPDISGQTDDFFTFVGFYAYDNVNLTIERFVVYEDDSVVRTKVVESFDS